MSPVDLNCDLGEGEPSSRTRALMQWVTSVNVACGGHAGDAASMRRCALLAASAGVRLGAHPGPWDRKNFGRGRVEISPAELELLLLQQVGGLSLVARSLGTPLHHVKLHGGLYHAVEESPRLAAAYLGWVARHLAGCRVYARAGGEVCRAGSRLGVEVWGEAFVDRGYLPDGSLVGRAEPGALLTRRDEVIRRVDDLLERGGVVASDRSWISVAARTFCLHGDTPRSARIASWVRGRIDLRSSQEAAGRRVSTRGRGGEGVDGKGRADMGAQTGSHDYAETHRISRRCVGSRSPFATDTS